MSPLLAEIRQALHRSLDTAENPFYWRQRRSEARRGEPWRSLWTYSIVLGATYVLALYILYALIYLDAFDGRIPKALAGGDAGRAAFAVLAAIHFCVVFATSRGEATSVLEGEARSGTLYQLAMTRLTSIEVALQICLYPFQRSMLLVLAGMPLYALCIAFGSIGPRELAALVVLLTCAAIPSLSWRTPAFAEQSPEQMSRALTRQKRAAGCITALLAFVMVPAAVAA